ncbi:hypothetical protein J2129_002049 [Methanofollis sp. W23]|nr:hypothetical protein [Methanofollis sp. W23]
MIGCAAPDRRIFPVISRRGLHPWTPTTRLFEDCITLFKNVDWAGKAHSIAMKSVMPSNAYLHVGVSGVASPLPQREIQRVSTELILQTSFICVSVTGVRGGIKFSYKHGQTIFWKFSW